MARILVVEDSPTQAEQLRYTLEQEGFTAKIVGDAEGAVGLLDSEHFDLVISDIMLPGASGFDLCRELKRRSSELPVLMLSSLTDPMAIIRSLECGADYFLTKPYGPEHLVARIRTALSTSRIRKKRAPGGAVDVVFRGRAFAIHSDKEQVLDLLLSTFEDIVRTNEALERSRAELSAAKRQLERHADHLKELVEERTSELVKRQEQLSDAQKVARLGNWQLDVASWSVTRSDSMCKVVCTNLRRQDFDEALQRIHEEDRERARQTIKFAIENKVSFEMEVRLVQREGAERIIWFIGQPKTNAAGAVEELFGTAQDITDRKRVERQLLEAKEQLYKAQKMEAIGQLTGGMSHDFNNLLAVIIGNLDLAREEISDREVLESVDEALNAAMRGAELNQRLLAFAKRQALQPEATEVNGLVSDVAKLLDRVLGEQVRVELRLTADLEPALVDSSQLESAVTNLAINARDAMPEGGRITIRTGTELLDRSGEEELAGLNPGEYVVIEVSDTGTGMPPDVLQRVREPFFTTKEVGKGSGLGLSMVSGFVEQSGGALRIHSVPGEGSTMSLYLPKAPLDGLAHPEEDEEASSAGPSSGTVLVVEDNDSLRSVLIKQLHSLGYQAIEAATGDAALPVIQSGREIDVLFTDVVMPGSIDGRRLVEEARKIRPDLKIVVSSGFQDVVGSGEFDQAGVTLLKKPYKKATLARTLSALLS